MARRINGRAPLYFYMLLALNNLQVNRTPTVPEGQANESIILFIFSYIASSHVHIHDESCFHPLYVSVLLLFSDSGYTHKLHNKRERENPT